MADENFKEGDTVQIKSGGPIMTITFIEEAEAYCQWFDKNDIKGSRFRLSMLVAA